MSTQKIIITFLVVFFSLFFIVNSTYYFGENNIGGKSKEFKKEIGLQEVVRSGSGVSLGRRVNSTAVEKTKIYVDQVNAVDRVYFSTETYAKEISENNITFLLSKGIYLFDLYDITNNYTIQSDTFRLKIRTPGKIFIDTREKNIKIFSLSSVFSVQLMHEGIEMTNLALYPKMYFGFNETRNKSLKNADLLRLETLTHIFYFNGEILNDEKKIHPLFLKKLGFSTDTKVKTFFSDVFQILFSPGEISKYDVAKIGEQLIRQDSITGLYYIQKYFGLFLNKQKKIAYYKGNIIQNLNKLFGKESINKFELLNDLSEFKALDSQEYDHFIPIVYYYYDFLLKINSLEYIKKSILLSEVIMEINGTKKDIYDSYFYLNKIYSLVNNKTFTNNDLQANFLEFLKLFLDEKHITVNKNYLFTLKDKKLVDELDYLSLFIKNILIHDVSFGDISKLSNVIHIFKIYSSINENINIIKNNAKAETIVIENSRIVEKILSEMRMNFFQKELNEKGLLQLTPDDNITQALTENLISTTNLFFKFYNAKKRGLSEKNLIYNTIYQKNQTQFEEYALALSNYSDYTTKYDPFTKEIFDTKTVVENVKEIELNRENLVNYLSAFEGVDVENFKFLVIGKQYYKISNLIINGETFSFHLYPKKYNEITNIFKNGEKINQTYELDNIKMERDELFKNASDEDRDKYDFRKFFINLFFTQKNNENEQFVDDTMVVTENKNILLFKRDKLLGERGEFSLLKGYLDLKFNNILVEQKNNVYDIDIKDSMLTTTVQIGDENQGVIGIINAEYVFNQKDHYFKNISIQFYNEELYRSGEMISLFDGKTFQINKNINIVDFKKEMDSIIQGYFTNN